MEDIVDRKFKRICTKNYSLKFLITFIYYHVRKIIARKKFFSLYKISHLKKTQITARELKPNRNN